jgi:agmatine deiminase
MTPHQLGYYFPAEFAPHEATWLSWPHKEASWPGKIKTIFPVYAEFVRRVAEGEAVRINVRDEAMKQQAIRHLADAGRTSRALSFSSIPPTMPGAATTGRRFCCTDRRRKRPLWIGVITPGAENTRPMI